MFQQAHCERKFHTNSKWGLKMFHTILEKSKFFDRGSRELTIQIFNSYEESWPKFEQVTKKEPTPRTFRLLAFDVKFIFFFALFRHIKRGWVYMPK